MELLFLGILPPLPFNSLKGAPLFAVRLFILFLGTWYLGLGTCSAQIPTTGLVAHYPFNGNVNVNDESGNDNLPTFIYISDGKLHDVNALDGLISEENAFYVMDRAYVDYSRLYRMNLALSYFVVRAKDNLKFRVVESRKIDKKT
ncbi:MAG: hypothetical protein HY958_11830, partial [Bacteroidia bacterium]|nr:hypothetical protein [Bacteroidia bacterium]